VYTGREISKVKDDTPSADQHAGIENISKDARPS
jgi:hypothetical protein